MSAVLALETARKAGARVLMRDGRLVVQSQGQLPAELLADLQEHRDQLLQQLLPIPSAFEDACAEYDRLGDQVDELGEQAVAARARGDAAEAARLSAAACALVEGPYAQARHRVDEMDPDRGVA